MRRLRRTILTTGLVAISLLASSPSATADPMGWYLPLAPGASWTYEDPDDPSDTFTDRVLDVFEYEGHPAYRFGQDMSEHVIVYREGGVVTVYGRVDGGALRDLEHDVVLDEILDGSILSFCWETPCDSSLVREWMQIDPALRAIYGIDPQYTDMVLIASYDPNYDRNLHNVAVESNLPAGSDPPSGAVTGMEWYLRGVGTIILVDIDAESGGVAQTHVLVGITPAPLPAPLGAIDQLSVTPNPFNPVTAIRYRTRGNGQVRVEIFDLAGRRVRQLFIGWQPAGEHRLLWDGRDDEGQTLASAVYLCRAGTRGVTTTTKAILLK